MALHPTAYAKLLHERITRHDVNCWLINTGLIGGAYGIGKRVKIAHTRAMVKAALTGALNNVSFIEEPVFNLSVPTECPGVPPDILNPRNTWSSKDEYDRVAEKLAENFRKNFEEYKDSVSAEVVQAGPRKAKVSI